MSRKDKLNDLIVDVGLRCDDGFSFGTLVSCRVGERHGRSFAVCPYVTSTRARRSLARRMMSLRKQIFRKHGVRITGWEWCVLPQHSCDDVMRQSAYLGVVMF